MTASAMILGMAPMAIGASEGGAQAAPLGRAVIGGLLLSTFATLTILPSIYAILQSRAGVGSPSLNPMDRHSSYFDGADSFDNSSVNESKLIETKVSQ
jgi:hypothetical protein